MCGVAGAFIPSNVGWIEPRELRPMIGAVAHRGPDDMDYWVNGPQTVMLMHARLALVDPQGGRQPLSNETGSVWLTCNGEIYGYQDTMAALQAKGHRLRSRCDVEVIPHLFEDLGPACFAKLNSEFAFALYDEKRHELYLVRDRFGVKPLYYCRVGDTVAFGSELKSVLSYPSLPAELNHKYIRGLLAGISLPEETILQDINEVPPGHFVRISQGGVSVQLYWSLALNGDAPVGAYLSSGVDSCSVVDAMALHKNADVKAFTIRFEDPGLDETQIASRVATICGVDHHVDVSNQALADNFRTSLWHSEIPVFNTHGTAKFLLSRACQPHVKAILTGEGADETLAGYAMYRHQLLLDEQRKTGERSVKTLIKEMIAREGILAGLLPETAYRRKAMVETIFGCYPYAALRALSAERLMGQFFQRGFVDNHPLEEALMRLAGRQAGRPAAVHSQPLHLAEMRPSCLQSELPGRPAGNGQLHRRAPAVPGQRGGRLCVSAAAFRTAHREGRQAATAQRCGKPAAELRQPRPKACVLGTGQRSGHTDAEQLLRGGAEPGCSSRRGRVRPFPAGVGQKAHSGVPRQKQDWNRAEDHAHLRSLPSPGERHVRAQLLEERAELLQIRSPKQYRPADHARSPHSTRPCVAS